MEGTEKLEWLNLMSREDSETESADKPYRRIVANIYTLYLLCTSAFIGCYRLICSVVSRQIIFIEFYLSYTGFGSL